jgi:TDG/mug DNA glycosylase family protein
VTVLPDVLEPGLRIVFCGTAAGARSAELGQPYAGPGNKFWRVIEGVGLTPTRLTPAEFRDLPRYGIGLTDLAKFASGSDSMLRSADFDPAAFAARIAMANPRVVAFNGKRSAQQFFGGPAIYGERSERLGESRVFVLPSTSGAASGFWDVGPWRLAAAAARASRPRRGSRGRRSRST